MGIPSLHHQELLQEQGLDRQISGNAFTWSEWNVHSADANKKYAPPKCMYLTTQYDNVEPILNFFICDLIK